MKNEREILEQKFLEKYNKLNKEQKLAVDTVEGPVLVIAGPGTGKTELLSMRVANILRKTDAGASSILCLTFTEAGATQMKKRIINLTGRDGYKVFVSTFHSFCNYIIERFPKYFFDEVSFSMATELQKINILNEILDELPHNHIYAKKFSGGYLYQNDILKKISKIKNSSFALNAEFKNKILELEKEWKEISKIYKKYNSLFSERLSLKLINDFENLLKDLEKINSFSSNLTAEKLKLALREAEEIGKTSPIKNWKDDFLARDEDQEFIFSDEEKLEKLMALAEIYDKYTLKMKELELRDYDDMIIEVIVALKKYKDLAFDIGEEYQYILLDEFQDTNDAQFRIIEEITKNEIYADSPNILCVGDDDQGIYKFQGAESSNILKFIKNYKNVVKIVLDQNYRSNQNILDLSKSVIDFANDRLVNKDKSIIKDLKAKNEEIIKSNSVIEVVKSIDDITEYSFVANKIKSLIDEGIEEKEIAIIARKHKSLNHIKDYLIAENVKFSHVGSENIFENQMISEIILMMRFCAKNLEKIEDKNEYEQFLPEILSSEFLEINANSVLDLSLNARVKKIDWLTAMKDSNDIKIKTLANFLISVSKESKNKDIREILDIIIGNEKIIIDIDNKKVEYFSPLKNYYFENKENSKNYFLFLEALRKLIEEINEYFGDKKKNKIKLNAIEGFLNDYEENEINVSVEKTSLNKNDGVNLLTAHGSKGLEFKHVFLIDTDDKTWKSSNKDKISFPATLPLEQSGDDNDIIKLLFVAITRAKTHLTISYHKNERVEFLANLNIEEKIISEFDNKIIKKEMHKMIYKMDFDQNKILKDIAIERVLSISAINNFFDIYKGGPEYFLKTNILYFPTASFGVAADYGNAMHHTINYAYNYFNKNKKLPSLKMLKEKFTEEGFDEENPDEKRNYEKGLKAIERYYEKLKIESKNVLDSSDYKIESELSFKGRGISLSNDVEITGSIDKMIINKNKLEIYDFKTGGTLEKIDEKSGYKSIKAHQYKYQLAFYKILLSEDKIYKDFKIEKFALHFLDEEDKNLEILEVEIDNEIVERVKNLTIIVSHLMRDLQFKIGQEFMKYNSENQKVEDIIKFEDYILETYKDYLN